MGILSRIIQILENLGKLDPADQNAVYAKKLEIIRSCIYGADIQNIAVQITKLRFFISLLCEQKKDAAKKNFGINLLPNLETKIVCANSLIALPQDGDELPLEKEIIETRNELRDARAKYFSAKDKTEKQTLRKKDKELRERLGKFLKDPKKRLNRAAIARQEEILARLKKERAAVPATPKWVVPAETEQLGLAGIADAPAPRKKAQRAPQKIDLHQQRRNELSQKIDDAELRLKNLKNPEISDAQIQAADLIAAWNPYDPANSAKFFDPEHMFGIPDGFDIVIGNPPYVQVPKGIVSKERFPYSEGMDKGKQNLYKLFIEGGYNLLHENGNCCMIVQSSLMGDVSSKYTRELLLKHTRLQQIIEFPKNVKGEQKRVFDSVLQGTCVFIFTKEEKGISQNQVSISIGNSRASIKNPQFGTLSQQEIFDFSPAHEIPLLRPCDGLVYRKIKNGSTRLNDFLKDSAQGNINTIHLPKILSKKPTGAYIAKGAHIHPYYMDEDLFHCALNKTTKTIFEKNEGEHLILTQNITGTTDARRIHACYLECRSTKIVLLDSVNISYLQSPEDAIYIAALLNSKLIDWTFRVTSTNNHVNIYELNNLPIKKGKNFKEITRISQKISLAKKKNAGADTSALERKINALVYALYGLTDAEIAAIENAGAKSVPATPSPAHVVPAPKPRSREKVHSREPIVEDDEGLD